KCFSCLAQEGNRVGCIFSIVNSQMHDLVSLLVAISYFKTSLTGPYFISNPRLHLTSWLALHLKIPLAAGILCR
ncbi:hypothetical protein ACI0FS_23070, partial [Ochrobactrum quorumnocens]|uniref:hypothetical protein n=1 Tax=Ochrobactrum quorumnocens TaxID=271865 RepID=UPI003854D3C2